jgi:hypothetical protein
MTVGRSLSARALAGAVFAALMLAIPAGAAVPFSVRGGLTLDDFGNKLSISASPTTAGGAEGHAVLQSGLAGIHNEHQPQVIRIRITCLIPLSASTVIVGGVPEGATAGVGTIFPNYTFVLEDRGPGLQDKWTLFYGSPCSEAFGPATETAVRGNIVVGSG